MINFVLHDHACDQNCNMRLFQPCLPRKINPIGRPETDKYYINWLYHSNSIKVKPSILSANCQNASKKCGQVGTYNGVGTFTR